MYDLTPLLCIVELRERYNPSNSVESCQLIKIFTL